MVLTKEHVVSSFNPFELEAAIDIPRATVPLWILRKIGINRINGNPLEWKRFERSLELGLINRCYHLLVDLMADKPVYPDSYIELDGIRKNFGVVRGAVPLPVEYGAVVARLRNRGILKSMLKELRNSSSATQIVTASELRSLPPQPRGMKVLEAVEAEAARLRVDLKEFGVSMSELSAEQKQFYIRHARALYDEYLDSPSNYNFDAFLHYLKAARLDPNDLGIDSKALDRLIESVAATKRQRWADELRSGSLPQTEEQLESLLTEFEVHAEALQLGPTELQNFVRMLVERRLSELEYNPEMQFIDPQFYQLIRAIIKHRVLCVELSGLAFTLAENYTRLAEGYRKFAEMPKYQAIVNEMEGRG